jgi:rhodanese-related sulfurtransferase
MSPKMQHELGLVVDLRASQREDAAGPSSVGDSYSPPGKPSIVITLLDAKPLLDSPNGLNALQATQAFGADHQPSLVIYTSQNAVATVHEQTDLLAHWVQSGVLCAAVGAATRQALGAAWPPSAPESGLLPICSEPGIVHVLKRFVSSDCTVKARPVFVIGTPGGASERFVAQHEEQSDAGQPSIRFFGVYGLELNTSGAHQLLDLYGKHVSRSKPEGLILSCRSGTVVRAAARVLSDAGLQPVPFKVWGASASAAAIELGLPIWPLS